MHLGGAEEIAGWLHGEPWKRESSCGAGSVADLDIPFAVLASIAVALLVIEFTVSLPPQLSKAVLAVGTAVWLAFLADFLIELALAHPRGRFLWENWIIAISVVLPFLRVFRLARVFRPYLLARVVAVANRSIAEVASIFRGRQFAYIVVILMLASLTSAAGIYYLERGVPGSTFHTYGDALWFVAKVITTLGADPGPVTAEGRMLAVIVMVAGISFFGYVTAAIASYFVRRDTGEDAGSRRRLESEIAALRTEIERLRRTIEERDGG